MGTVDAFLLRTGVASLSQALKNSLTAALRHNPTYEVNTGNEDKKAFRRAWAELIAAAAEGYKLGGSNHSQEVADAGHCEVIARISQAMGDRYGDLLIDGELRIGTSQKALNLYLKYLWRLGCRPKPPHCPVDRGVLQELGLRDSWVWCRDVDQYLSWIDEIRFQTETHPAAWEYDFWNEAAG